MISPRLYSLARFASAAILGALVAAVVIDPPHGTVAANVWALVTAWIWLWVRPSYGRRLSFGPQLRRRVWPL